MLIEVKEAINGWTLEVIDHENPRPLEVFETKSAVLFSLQNYVSRLLVNEHNKIFEGVN